MSGQKSYYEYFNGKGKWIKAVTPDPKFHKWNMQLYPYDKDLEKFRELQSKGVLTRLKKDDEGYNFQLSRPTSKVMRGELVAFTPPLVMDKDGNIIEGLKIGNGSDVTAKVQVYSYPKPTGGRGIAIRWEALKVLNLVPFKTEDFPEGSMEAAQASDLEGHPEPLW